MLSSTGGLDVRPLTRLFRALGDETRLRIVALLSHGELCVCHIETALDLNQGELNLEREVLRDYGNMSAPTVLFVLERLLARGLPDRVLMTAFGPGFTCAGLMLEAA